MTDLAVVPHGYIPDYVQLCSWRFCCAHCAKGRHHRVHQPRWWRILHPRARWR